MKIAVIFPGVGYHVDKPLLYYSKKIAKEQGYEIVDVSYGGFAEGIKGSVEKMETAFYSALAQTEEILADVEFEKYKDILFISKSVGTAVAAAYAGKYSLNTRNIYYTPVAASFQFMKQPGIVFHGTGDTWVETRIIKEECKKRNLPLYVTEGANHSMEAGKVIKDIKILKEIMRITKEYIKKNM